MRVACILLCSFVSIAAVCLEPAITQGQTVSDLPRPEYYVAKSLFGAGRTAEAADGFSSALRRARRVGDIRWIDSIPPLVMLGECYYQQGSLAAALEQYDAAMMLALANPGWINLFDAGREQLPALDGYAKGINWFPRSQATVSASVPESIQIAIDPTQAQIGAGGIVTAPISFVTRLDATEVFRTMSIALQRRLQILGPLAPFSPLTHPLTEHFAVSPIPPSAWVQSSWRVLRGIHSLSTNSGVDGPATIRSGTLLGDQFDYFMTSSALLMLAELNMNSGNFQAAITNLQDSAMIAAKFEQHSELAQSLRLLAAAACASRRTELLQPLQSAADWSAKQSGISNISARIGAAELAIYSKQPTIANRLMDQAGVILRNREIALPRDQAHLFFVRAMAGFAQNQRAVGLSNLDSALTLMRGNAQSGAVVESIFQAQMCLDLLATGALTTADAEVLLASILAEPDAIAWQKIPLKTLAAITTSSLPAYERLLEMADLRGDEAEIYSRLDRVQRQRFYEALPLGGRLLNVRKAVNTPLANLPPRVRTVVERTFQEYPSVKTTTARVQELVAQLQQAPLPMDERVMPAPAKKLYAELESLSLSLENQLAFQCLLRKPFDRYLPTNADQDVHQHAILPGDLVVGLARAGNNMFGIAMTKDQILFWRSSEAAAIKAKTIQLLAEVGLTKQLTVKLPSAVNDANAAWRKISGDLSTQLFTPKVMDLVRKADRVILAPNSNLWYIPFELLPVDNKPGGPLWLQAKPVTYVPTLGSYGHAYAAKPNLADTTVLVGKLFSLDREINLAASKRAMSTVSNSSTVMLEQKHTVMSPTWLRIRARQLLVAAITTPQGWETNVMQLGRTEQNTVGSWLQTPINSPDSVLLPGFTTTMTSGNLGDGNEIFLPMCGMLFSGTQTALISRWPVGGRSSAEFLKRYMTELETETASEAMRRSALSLWADNYLVAEEPALLPAGNEANTLCSGAHPLLWSSYMVLGDTRQP